MVSLKTAQEIEILKKSGAILKSLLHELSLRAQKGVLLTELDSFARSFAKKHSAYPAFLNYRPEGARHAYQAAICTSLNETVVHGVPHQRRLVLGDVLKIDAGIIYEGMYTDAATTVVVGKASPQVKRLINATRKALDEAIALVRPGKTVGDIGWIIERRARLEHCKVLRALTGHGVGYELHEDPPVYNYGNRGEGMVLREGMVLAIEPMFSLSSEDIVQQSDESYASADGSFTAHFEHTVVVTKRGHLVITG